VEEKSINFLILLSPINIIFFDFRNPEAVGSHDERKQIIDVD
jgi:hypothetical protein